MKHKREALSSPPAHWMVVGIFAFGAVRIAGRASVFSVRAFLVLSTVLIIAAAGQPMTILISGIDFSIPFVVDFANVAVAQLGSECLPFGLAMTIVIGLTALLGCSMVGWP